MANYPSAIKRNRQAPKRRARNRQIIGNMRAALKAARQAVGVEAGERIVATIHLGEPLEVPTPRDRQPAAALTRGVD